MQGAKKETEIKNSGSNEAKETKKNKSTKASNTIFHVITRKAYGIK